MTTLQLEIEGLVLDWTDDPKLRERPCFNKGCRRPTRGRARWTGNDVPTAACMDCAIADTKRVVKERFGEIVCGGRVE